MLKKMKPINNIIIPSNPLQIHKEPKEPNQNPNSNSLFKNISIVNKPNHLQQQHPEMRKNIATQHPKTNNNLPEY